MAFDSLYEGVGSVDYLYSGITYLSHSHYNVWNSQDLDLVMIPANIYRTNFVITHKSSANDGQLGVFFFHYIQTY